MNFLGFCFFVALCLEDNILRTRLTPELGSQSVGKNNSTELLFAPLQGTCGYRQITSPTYVGY